MRHCLLVLEARKWLCRACGHGFRQQFPGILKWQRASEAFRRMIFFRHWDGISRRRLGQREGLSSATIERWFQYVLKRLAAERRSSRCPAVLGIDEHFFSRRHGFATTLCDVKNHTVYDVVLGRSEASLEGYFPSLEGKGLVRVVCMDLASVYRAIVRKHFPNALIVADRFHVIRLINHHFLGCWRDLDAVGSKNRGLLSRMRRHRHNLQPAQSEKVGCLSCRASGAGTDLPLQTAVMLSAAQETPHSEAVPGADPSPATAIHQLRQAGLAQLVQLGQTLASWSQEIVAMWRFTRNNGITEGFHTKMELLQRQAYGFRNFQNYRLRVKVMCS